MASQRSIRLAVLLSLVTLQFKAASADELGRKWERAISSEALSSDEILAINFDSDICEASSPKWSDLLIVDSNGRVVPYLIDRTTARREQSSRTSWVGVNAGVKPDDTGLEITIRLRPNEPNPSGFRVVTPLRNFEQSIEVLGVAAEGESKVLVKDALIADYSEFMDFRSLEVELPNSNFRTFRLVFRNLMTSRESPFLELTREFDDSGKQSRTERIHIERRPFRVDQIRFWKDETQVVLEDSLETAWMVKMAQTAIDEENRETVVTASSRMEPLTELTLATEERNFRRDAIVEIPVIGQETESWVEIASAKLARIDLRGLKYEQLSLEFPETRSPIYRIRIQNQDNPPLSISGVTGRGATYRAVFLASPDESYSLRYGREQGDLQHPPQYDVAAIQSVLGRGEEPVKALLGDAVLLNRQPKPETSLLDNPILIGAGICILMAALGMSLFNAGRRIDKLPE